MLSSRRILRPAMVPPSSLRSLSLAICLLVLMVGLATVPFARAFDADVDSELAAASSDAPVDHVHVQFDVQLGPSKSGAFVVEVRPDWAPLGAQRFLDLVDGKGPDGEPSSSASGTTFWKGLRFFRVLDGFMAQFGIAPKAEASAVWREAALRDDPVATSNERGTLSFATSGKDSRTSQMFINFSDNKQLDGMGFAPFAAVVRGMDVVDGIYKRYGETPDQGKIQELGNKYLKKAFPNLSYVKSVRRIDIDIDINIDASRDKGDGTPASGMKDDL